MLTSYTFVAALTYYIALSHCILQTIFQYQTKSKSSSVIYHVIPHAAGIFYAVLAGPVYHDIGKGVMLTCAMEYGSFIEYYSLSTYLF